MSAVEKTSKTASAANDIDPDIIHYGESLRAKRNRILRDHDINYETTRKAWFTLSHMLLDDGAKIIDSGCKDGSVTFAMAALYPNMHFIGLDKNRRLINQANAKYELPNLEFKVGDVTNTLFPENSVDAIINTNILHILYSNSEYNEQIVTDTLATQFSMLKTGGIMFIRDYAHPPPEEFVLMEIPDEPSAGDTPSKLSDADLLVWYGEHARPRQNPLYSGFFLEELPPRKPDTRLFRLPYKWAYEFILRKDDREHWDQDLPVEYMFFTPLEFRRTLKNLGARVNYAGPQWDEDYMRKNYAGRFRLFSNDEKPLGDPPTSYIFVATKMPENKSLIIEERRPGDPGDASLTITGMRNKKTGSIVDVVRRTESFDEIIPYRIDENNRLKIYLHDGVARGVVNAVPRNGQNFDERRWSGHMVEQISLSSDKFSHVSDFTTAETAKFAKTFLGLKPASNASIKQGQDYYPAPNYIDERIFTYFLEVDKPDTNAPTKTPPGMTGSFQSKGRIHEFEAQQILDAIAVGMIPNARLELQILSLFEHLNIKAENWNMKEFRLQRSKVTNKAKVKDILLDINDGSKAFEESKTPSGNLRRVHSLFVEEGMSDQTVKGLSAAPVDFVVHEEETVNIAVVLPISKGVKNDIHAGFILERLPIPQRYEGKATTIAAPSFVLPPEITNIKMAKHYVADQFGVSPDMVFKLAESYFTHTGLTAQRIHPFAVANPQSAGKYSEMQFLPFYQLKLLRKLLGRSSHFMIAIARAFRLFHDDIRMDLQRRASAIVQERFNEVKPDWGLPLYYDAAPVGKTVVDLAGTSENTPETPAPTNKPKANLYKPDPDMQLTNEFEDFMDTLAGIKATKPDGPKPEEW